MKSIQIDFKRFIKILRQIAQKLVNLSNIQLSAQIFSKKGMLCYIIQFEVLFYFFYFSHNSIQQFFRQQSQQTSIQSRPRMNIKFANNSPNHLDITKNSAQFKTKGCISMSDVNKLYRREEIYKKKLKNIVQANSFVQIKIKNYETTIKEERSAINFQLSELNKTMMSKVSSFVEEKIDKDRFKTNEAGLQTIKQMMSKFQLVQRESKVNKRVEDQLNSINVHYKEYSDQIYELVELTQKSNKQYETGIKNMMNQKVNQINAKKSQNENIFDATQTLIKKIDQFQQGKQTLIQQEKGLQKYIDKLKKVQQQSKKQVQKFTKWAEIVIDKNHRKVFYKENHEKQIQLKKIKDNNSRMEVYLHELEEEEKSILKTAACHEKQNMKTRTKASKKSDQHQLKINKNQTKLLDKSNSLASSKITKKSQNYTQYK